MTSYLRIALCSMAVALSTGITGCTLAEDSATVTGLQSAFNTLTQNRSLAEQFVRDVKGSLPTSDTGYQQVQESYDEAAAAYNRYLDSVEMGGHTRGVAGEAVVSDAQSGITDFLATASKTLQPSSSTSRSLLRKAAPLPPTLSRDLTRMSKKDRSTIVSKLDDQVRWRSWSEL